MIPAAVRSTRRNPPAPGRGFGLAEGLNPLAMERRRGVDVFAHAGGPHEGDSLHIRVVEENLSLGGASR